MGNAKGPRGFDIYYTHQEGARWPILREACARENSHFGLQEGLLQTYWLDEASVWAARMLEARPGMRVLDMCAAPGGKSLVVASDLFDLRYAPDTTAVGGPPLTVTVIPGRTTEPTTAPATHDTSPAEPDPDSELICNEVSGTRRERLQRVLREHLPPPVLGRVRVYGHDATRWGLHEPDAYDAILLDAPCSSERHLIQDPAYLVDWSETRSERLAQQAYTLLLAAAQALKTGGCLVYCTCAVSNLENDLTVARVLARLAKKSTALGYHLVPDLPSPARTDLVAPWMEATDLGYRVLPDHADGRGPLYIARLRKVAADFPGASDARDGEVAAGD